MISLVQLPVCAGCQQTVDVVSEKQLCINCTGKTLISMRCPECGHTWENPGFAAWCPACGCTYATSDDKKIDEWMIWMKAAKENGILFVGIQHGTDDVPDMPVFQDHQTGSFTLNKGETISQAIDRKRREFKKT